MNGFFTKINECGNVSSSYPRVDLIYFEGETETNETFASYSRCVRSRVASAVHAL